MRRRSADGLAARRRKRRRVFAALGIFVFLACAGAALYGLWQPFVRIARIEVIAPQPSSAASSTATDTMIYHSASPDDALASAARAQLAGAYFGIVPRDSIFFFPMGAIRAGILAAQPQYAAVSISRIGFNAISLRPDARDAIARWCGPAFASSTPQNCYVFDANGYVFAAADSWSAPLVNPFTLYAPLAGSAQEPLTATVAHADEIPAAFDFARQVGALGSPVASVALRGDEVDDLLTSGTRITYVLGQEQSAFDALVSASQDLDLSDGSIDYVDLRFGDKVYVQKREHN